MHLEHTGHVPFDSVFIQNLANIDVYSLSIGIVLDGATLSIPKEDISRERLTAFEIF